MSDRISSLSLRPIVHGLAIIAAAAALCFPFLLVGVPFGSDSVDHATYQYYFSSQFWSGDLYPRWLAEANKGYGSPIFLGQYPLPYFITALLRPVLRFAPTDTRESRELGVYCFLMLAAAGIAAWIWFRNRCTPVASTIAAIAYMSLPYLLGLVVYDRTAIGELTAIVWMPLLFALCDHAHTKRFAVLSAIAVVFGLLIMSNILSAILFLPFIVLYAVASGRRATLLVLLALAFGICVAAIYMFPALAYQRLFNPGAFVLHRHFAQLGRNLLYVCLVDIHNQRIAIPAIVSVACLMFFIVYQIRRSDGGSVARLGMLLTLGLGIVLLIPGVGPALIELSRLRVSAFDSFAAYSMKILLTALSTVGLGLLAYCRISGRRTSPPENVLLVISCCTFLLMLPWTAVLWKVIPKTEIIQFPWRLCAILTVAASGLFAIAIDDCLRNVSHSEKRPSLLVMMSVALIVICFGTAIWRLDIPLRRLTTAHVDLTRWLDPMYFSYIPPLSLTAFANSVGAPSPDTYELASTPVEQGVRAEFTAGQGTASVKRVAPGKLLFFAQCQGDARVRIGQLYFPLWRIVPATGFPARGETLGSSAEDLMEVSLTSGQHEFWLVFDAGFPQRLGAIVSVASILLIIGGFALVGLRERKRRSNAKVSYCPS